MHYDRRMRKGSSTPNINNNGSFTNSEKIGLPSNTRKDKAIGITGMFVATILYTISAASVQLLERRIPDMELNLFRAIIPPIVYSIGLVVMKSTPWIERERVKVTVLYTLNVFFAGLLIYVSVSLLPVASAESVNRTSYMISGLLLLSIFWTEKLTIFRCVLALISLFGAIFVIQPEFMFADYVHTRNMFSNITSQNRIQTYTFTETKNITNLNQTVPVSSIKLNEIIGYSSAIVAGITGALDLLLMKHSNILDKILQVHFWTFVVNTCLSAILSFSFETPVLPSTWFDTTMVLLHAFSCAGIWPLYMVIPKYISGNTIALIFGSSVVFMLIAQYTVLSSMFPGHNRWLEIFGVILVLITTISSSTWELYKDKE